MTSRDEMVKLRERVRSASGPDREIDRNLALLFDAVNWPNFSSSIDAALALCERVLPEACLDLSVTFDGDGASCRADIDGLDPITTGGKHLPLAILDALLSALIQKDTSHVGS